MIQARHCSLCENAKQDLKNGLTCGLTDKNPDFTETCPDILLDEKFQAKLEDANLELNQILKVKRKKYWNFCLLCIIGSLIIIGNKLYAEFLHSTIRYWEHRIGAIGIGITVLIIAFFYLAQFKSKFKSVKFEKDKIDSVLEKYGITYKMEFDFKQEVHGDQEIEITTEYNNWTKKRTTTKAIIHCCASA